MSKRKDSKETNKKEFLISISNKLKDREVLHLIHLSRGVIIPASAADEVRTFPDLVAAMEVHKMLDETMRKWDVLYDILKVIKRTDLVQKIEKYAKEFSKRGARESVSIFVPLWGCPEQLKASTGINEEKKSRELIECKEILQKGNYSDLWKGVMGSGKKSVQIEIVKGSAGSRVASNAGLLQSQLKHENIVEVIKICRDHNPPWVVLEWTENGDLQNFVRYGQGRDLTVAKFIDFSVQIANGMVFLETRQIVHCNLKASSIFVFDNLTLKIGGFCIALHIGDAKVRDLEDEISPPIRWSAPEVVLYRHVNKRSDTWSFATVTMELFSKGVIPYEGLEKGEIISKLRNGYHPEKPIDCPNAFYRLMRRCWLEEYSRPSFAEILLELNKYKDSNDYSDGPVVSAESRRRLFQRGSQLNEDYMNSIEKSDDPPEISLPEWTDEIKLRKDSINLKSIIGEGEFGMVWRASLLPSNIDVAAKQIIVPVKSSNDFLKEVEMMRKFDHPHLLRLIGICIDQAPIYIVTELMPMGNLLKFLRDKTGALNIPLYTSLDYAAQVAGAMAYVEKLQCIHRDIAARNVFMKDERTVKLGDFGLSRKLSSSSLYQASTNALFPLRWTAPEAIKQKTFTIKSDVWSYGILLIEIITKGETPYPDMINEEVMASVLNGQTHPKPEQCPDSLYSLMTSCWKTMEDRPSFLEISEQIKCLRDKFPCEVSRC